MPAMRSARTVRSITLFGTLLLVSAFTVPAFAQIETVVVTAEKKAEDLQTVPIAVTAISGSELRQKEINQFKDLQFNVPNVTFAKTGLGSGIVTIRGISQVADDPGVAIYQDGIYSEVHDLAAANYYDLGAVEVLRGPQGTLYGRGSVGGTINIKAALPDVDTLSARADATYGDFATIHSEAMVNVPIIDGQLAARVSGQYTRHNGYMPNISPGQQASNGQDDYSFRGIVRWEPTPDTTIDLTGQYFNEVDTRTRQDNTMCLRDPSGVVGCLPNSTALQPSNGYANALGILNSKQFFTNFSKAVVGAVAAGVAGSSLATCNAEAALVGISCTGTFLTDFLALGPAIQNTVGMAALDDLTIQNGPGSNAAVANQIPQDLQKINTPQTPHFDETEFSGSVHVQQKVASWLTLDVLAGHLEQHRMTHQSYQVYPSEDIQTSINNGVPNLLKIIQIMDCGGSSIVGHPDCANSATRAANAQAYWFPQDGSGNYFLPFSAPVPAGSNIIPGTTPATISSTSVGIQKYTHFNESSDFEVNRAAETSGEVRFTSNFDGMVNFTVGAFYWRRTTPSAYYRVPFDGADYTGIFMANVTGPLLSLCDPPNGVRCDGPIPTQSLDPMYYQSAPSRARSTAVFSDFTINFIPDTFDVKLGLRWGEDKDSLHDNVLNFAGLSGNAIGAGLCSVPCMTHANSNAAEQMSDAQAIYVPNKTTEKDTSLWSYRAVAEYKPKLDFTDQTFLYLSLSTASKPGNLNLAVAGPPGAIPAVFKPEELTSLEFGAKNTFFDGTVQANLTAWYYRYHDLHVTAVAYSTLFTQNINANMWGQEFEMVWQPDEHFSINANLTNSDSGIRSGSYLVDLRNGTAGRTNATEVKDIYLTAAGDVPGNTCVVLADNPANTVSPADNPGAFPPGADPFIAPGGGSTQLRAGNTPGTINYFSNVNFGICTANLTGTGYHYAGPADGTGSSPTGIAANLKGRHVPNLPSNTLSVGAQYIIPMFSGYTLVPRADFYMQNGYFSRVWNDHPDAVGAWKTLNLQIQFNAPDQQWYVKGFVTNVLGDRNIEAKGLASDTSGLYTSVVLEDPRVFGVTLGARY
jgi:iron complex outermembrane receptor protein